PVPTGRVGEDGRRNGVRACLELREERLEVLRWDRAAEPPEAGEEHELELPDHWAGGPREGLGEAPPPEISPDAAPANPAEPAIDDDELAVIDVPEAGQVPAGRAVAAERPNRYPGLRRADDAHIDPG